MNSIFPASYSTLHPEAVAALIAKQYALTNVRCSLIIRGVGDTYLVESAEERYILRVYRNDQRSEQQVKEETDLLLALKDAEVPVSYPVKDTSGRAIQVIDAAEGMRCAVLFTYAPGNIVSLLSDPQLRNLGQQMARLHNVSAAMPPGTNRWAFDIETTLHKPLELLRAAFAEDPDSYAWMQHAAEQVERKLAQLDTASFSSGYCHYDMLTKNFHFDGNSVTFFDFDFMGRGWLVNDIMTFWQQLCLDVHYGKMKQDAADRAYAVFLEGYREKRAVSEDELAAVPYLSLGFWLFYSAFHTTHDQFYAFIHPMHLRLRFALVRKLMERHWQSEYLPK